MKAETQIKIGKLTALSMCVLHGMLLLTLGAILSLSLGSARIRSFVGSQTLFIGIPFSLYAVFAYAVTHSHKRTSVAILVILYMVSLVFGISRGTIERLVLFIAAFVPIGNFQVWRHPQTFWYVYMLIMPVVMCLLLFGVLGVYKAKKGKVK